MEKKVEAKEADTLTQVDLSSPAVRPIVVSSSSGGGVFSCCRRGNSSSSAYASVSPSDETSEYTHSPELDAGCGSLLFFEWMSPLMKQGYKRQLDFEDLYPIHPSDKSSDIEERFQKSWKTELRRVAVQNETLPEERKKMPSMVRPIRKSFGRPFLVAGLFKFG